MGLYNFKPQFVPFILAGEKTHTIREERKDGWIETPGNIMHMYTGLRTPKAKRFMCGICVRVEEIVITDGPLSRINLNGHLLDTSEEEALARRDGFENFAAMMKFWDGRLPFKGFIIHWRPLEKSKWPKKKKRNESGPKNRLRRRKISSGRRSAAALPVRVATT
jgi:hypothetical protein